LEIQIKDKLIIIGFMLWVGWMAYAFASINANIIVENLRTEILCLNKGGQLNEQKICLTSDNVLIPLE